MLRVPKGAVRVPLEGKTIIPGLINAHGHVQVEANGRLAVREDLLRRLNTSGSTPAFFTDPFFLRGQALYGEQIAMLSDPARQQRVRGDANAQAIKPALAQAKRNLQLLSAAGAAIAMGTDSGAAGAPGRWQGYFEHVELELMVEAGLTPLQALVAATSGAALALALRDQGSLEPGKHADLIVLNADPLIDIKNTRQIHSVWLAGKQFDASAAK